MHTVSVHEAETNFSKLLSRVSEGEEIVIYSSGKPIAQLIAWREPAYTRKAGLDRGCFQVPEDFDAPLPDEVLDAFEK